MRRSASSMSLVGPAKDSRTNEPPALVSKSMPGAIATPVSANSFEQNASESPVRCGDVGVDVERAVGRCQPVDADLAQAAQQQLPVGGVVVEQRVGLGDRFRRERRDGGVCASAGGQMVKFPVRQSTARCSSRGTSSHPSRHPVIAKYFEKLFTTMASRDVSHAQLVSGAPAIHQTVVHLVADQPHA